LGRGAAKAVNDETSQKSARNFMTPHAQWKIAIAQFQLCGVSAEFPRPSSLSEQIVRGLPCKAGHADLDSAHVFMHDSGE
jgi:hypothetical protein